MFLDVLGIMRDLMLVAGLLFFIVRGYSGIGGDPAFRFRLDRRRRIPIPRRRDRLYDLAHYRLTHGNPSFSFLRPWPAFPASMNRRGKVPAR